MPKRRCPSLPKPQLTRAVGKWTTLRSATSCPLTHSPCYYDRPHRSADISDDDQGTSYPDDLQTVHSVLDTGPYQGHGPHRKYGDKLAYRQPPDSCLQSTSRAGHIETRIYQTQARHKQFSQPLNVVIIVKTHLQTQAWAHVILFSSDLTLAYAQLIDYCRLRFQIEFNFRDAKQYWGLEDFMNTSETAVTNAANLALFMVNFSQRLLHELRPTDPECSILDLKALWRGTKYIAEAIKLPPEKPEPILLARIFSQLAALGRIHGGQPALNSP